MWIAPSLQGEFSPVSCLPPSPWLLLWLICLWISLQSKNAPHSQGEYDVYSTFQSHEPEFDYLKSLEIEEKINKIKWLPQQNAAHSLLSTNGEAWRWGQPDLTQAYCFLCGFSDDQAILFSFPWLITNLPSL